MKKILFILILAGIAYGFLEQQSPSPPAHQQWSENADSTLQAAFKNRQSNLQVQGSGVVVRILPDDNEGSRHQKFILKLGSGQTLLVAHNIDLAPRVSGLGIGDSVEFFGEYEWNSQGGVIHWTHHDPQNRHVGGWLKHAGKTYQ